MLNIFKIFIFSCLFLAASQVVLADTISLKQFPSANQTNGLTGDITLKVGNDTYPLAKTEIVSWIHEKNELIYNPSYLTEIENTHVCQHEKSITCSLMFSLQDAKHIQKSTTFLLNTDSINKFMEDLARKVNRDPVDAKLTMADGKVSVFSLSQKGLALDTKKSVSILIAYLTQGKTSSTLELPYAEINPEIATNSIENLGVTTLLGEGHSDFHGSPKNRVFNIKVATDRFNGVLIKPGEEFSFVKTLGEVDGEHGYLPELVIKNDKTEPEFGGGICQVSTTAFRAAIYSGLKITARQNHAYPVSYYNPQGMDSTVYIPKPDLKFINNTPNYILIQTEFVGTQLTFRFFGTSDGRRTNVIGPTILERNPDGSMKTTFSQQVFDANNNLIREDIFNSNYASPSKYPHPGQILTQKPADWSKQEWSKYLKDNKTP
jgi:vancomycin resistance protein YoaR